MYAYNEVKGGRDLYNKESCRMGCWRGIVKHFIGSPYPASPCRHHVLTPSHVFRFFVFSSPVSTTVNATHFTLLFLCHSHPVLLPRVRHCQWETRVAVVLVPRLVVRIVSEVRHSRTRPFANGEFTPCSCGIERHRNGIYEPLLQDNERDAIAELLRFLESKS